MENINSYLPLIIEWENYLAITKKADIKDFAFWILKKENIEVQKEEKKLDEYFDNNTNTHGFTYRSSEAAFLLWRMGKFIRYYTKPILIENGLASQDDFAILAHVDYKTNCSKREAIEANVIDSTTGIEIIKRLIKQGLISEKLNDDDKRQKIISLTESGKEVLYKIYIGFSNIQDVMADMNIEEREMLINILKSLDNYHTKNIEKL